MELWELTAREAIRDLVARYNANGDAGRLEHVYELFLPEATMEVGELGEERRVYAGLDEIKTIFTGAVQNFRDTAAERRQHRYLRHSVTTHQIDLVDRHHATGRAYFSVIRANGLDHWGRYLDEYEERDGRWRFGRRVVITDGWQAGA